MTTQCYGFGNGRFGHPEQDRAISLREAAILQSFPRDYQFFEPGKFPGFKAVGRWIGNAVPVALAFSIANSISMEISGRG
jgi:DNA (cytosine-5)-methyltransferase 1